MKTDALLEYAVMHGELEESERFAVVDRKARKGGRGVRWEELRRVDKWESRHQFPE